MYARLLVVLTVLGFASGAWAQQDKDDKQLLDGTWVPVTAELGGQKLALGGTKLVLAGGKYKLLSGETVTDQGAIVVDPEKKPKAMDVKGEEGPNKGKTFPAIYELKEDSLTICYDLDGKQRPTEFKTSKDTKLFLVTYKRSKS